MYIYACTIYEIIYIQGGNRPLTSSMDDSDDDFDQLVPPDNELDKVRISICIYTCT